MSEKIVLNPLQRVEGDLKVEVVIEGGRVREAQVSGVMFRGFENLLRGRAPLDALGLVGRICGVCSASHGLAAAYALQGAVGVEIPANGIHVQNLILGGEILINHILHFYQLFLPDLAHPAYRDYPHFKLASLRFSPYLGTSYTRAIRARAHFLPFLGLLAGKWPNTLALHPGGVTQRISSGNITRLKGILAEFQDFLEKHCLGISIKDWKKITTLGDLQAYYNDRYRRREGDADWPFFLRTAADLGLQEAGIGPNHFLAGPAFPQPGGGSWFKGGYLNGVYHSFEPTKIREDETTAYYHQDLPQDGLFEKTTRPYPLKPGAYSWTKAPRYNDEVVEVGPLARMLLDGDPLITDLYRSQGPNVWLRVIARMQDGLRIFEALPAWVNLLDQEGPFYQKCDFLRNCEGLGTVEAARGLLGHWIRLEGGRVVSYQVISPTTWNGSPRDGKGVPGAIEQALIGQPVKDSKQPVEVEHIVRSFDPCLSCSVHLLERVP